MYNKHIMSILRERRNLNSDDKSEDEEIAILTPREVFEELLEWEGIIGYSDKIIHMVEEVFGVNLV